jgi:hypothetical protein
MEDQPIRTKRADDDVCLGIEAPLARRHDTFALSYLSWIPLGSPIVEWASLDRALPEPSQAEAMQRAAALDPSSISRRKA